MGARGGDWYVIGLQIEGERSGGEEAFVRKLSSVGVGRGIIGSYLVSGVRRG